MEKKPKMSKVKELEKRIEELEQRPQYFPYYPPTYQPPAPAPTAPNPNLHYHGTMPCYNNPCYWVGNTG